MGMPTLVFPASGLCQAEREAPSVFFSSDPEDSCRRILPWLPARPWSGAAFLLVSPRGLYRRSAISLATRSTPAAHNHTAPGSCSSIYRRQSLDENFQNALGRPLWAQKLTGPAKGSGLVPYLKVLPFAGCSTFAVKHTHSDT